MRALGSAAVGVLLAGGAVAEAAEVVTYEVTSQSFEESGKKRADQFAPQFTLVEVHPGVDLAAPGDLRILCEARALKGVEDSRGVRGLPISYGAVFSELALEANTFGDGLVDEGTVRTDRQGSARFTLEVSRAWLSRDGPVLWQVEVVTSVGGSKKIRSFETACSLAEAVTP
jgi:hypothetical protein